MITYVIVGAVAFAVGLVVAAQRDDLRGSRPVALVRAAAVLIVVAGCVIAAVKFGADWLADTDRIDDPAKKAEEVGRARTAVLAVFAGLLALVGAYYTHRNFGLNRQGQVTERFTRAVDQLGNASYDVRTGAIYALERLARESREDHGPIVEILTAYIRIRGEIPPPEIWRKRIEQEPEHHRETLRVDLQAALTVLGRRTTASDPSAPWQLDLSGAHLPRASLAGAALGGANLSHTVLVEARGEGACLSNALLNDARLYSARLSGANLRGARLKRAHLRSADLSSADLSGADLSNADLSGADLSDADTGGACFDGASYSAGTKWPSGFDPSAAGAILLQTGLGRRYGETRTRTGDTTIFSRVLYQLSYLAEAGKRVAISCARPGAAGGGR